MKQALSRTTRRVEHVFRPSHPSELFPGISHLCPQSRVHWTCSLLSPKQVSKFWASFPCPIWESIQPSSLHLPSTPCWNRPKQDNCCWSVNHFKSFPFMSFYWRNSHSSTDLKSLYNMVQWVWFLTMFAPSNMVPFKTLFPLSLLHMVSLCQARCSHLFGDLVSISRSNVRK